MLHLASEIISFYLFINIIMVSVPPFSVHLFFHLNCVESAVKLQPSNQLTFTHNFFFWFTTLLIHQSFSLLLQD